MIIECEKCHTKFSLDENLLKEAGSKVRCSICKLVFTAFPPKTEPEVEKVPRKITEETMILSPEEIEAKLGQEGEGIEAISFEDLASLERDPIEAEEEKKIGVDEAIDRAAKFEEEAIAQKELESKEKAEKVKETVKPRPAIKKRSGSRLLITILLIILLLAGAGAALVVFKPDLLSEYIPFIKKPISKEQAFDMGNKRLSFKNLNGYFVNSEKLGKVYVVKGLVTNNYPDKRSFIRVRSNILDPKGKVVKRKISYAGNPISDKELQSLSIEEINNRLMDRFGKNKMNTNILPNSSIPFIIVFNKLPEDMSEFTVEAISSSPAEK